MAKGWDPSPCLRGAQSDGKIDERGVLTLEAAGGLWTKCSENEAEGTSLSRAWPGPGWELTWTLQTD